MAGELVLGHGGRRGAAGMAALALGSVAAASLPLNLGVAAGCGMASVVAAAMELVEVHRPRLREAVGGMVLGVGALLVALGLLASRSMGLSGLGTAFFDLSTVRGTLPQFLRGAVNTLRLAGLSELLGIVLGLLIALLANSRRRVLRFPAAVYVDLFRGTPLLVQLLLIYFGLSYIGLNLEAFVAGVVALGLNSAAYVAEIFRAGIQSVERGQVEAARTLGMPQRTAMRYVVMPQAVRRVIPPLMNELISLLKDSSLVVVLGATVMSREILQVAKDAHAQFANATPFVAASLVYLVLTVPLTRLVNHVDRRLRAAS